MEQDYVGLTLLVPITFCLIFGHYAGFLCNLMLWGHPLYFSMKAIESSTNLTKWLRFFMVYGLFIFLKPVEAFLASLVPAYFVCRFLACGPGDILEKCATGAMTAYAKARQRVNYAEIDRLIYNNSIGITFFVFGYLIFGTQAEFLCNLFCYLTAIYLMIRETESVTGLVYSKWLTYWIIFSHPFDFDQTIAQWVPLYWLLKCILHLYLCLPTTMVARKIYANIIRPIFLEYEKLTRIQWDNFLMSSNNCMLSLYLIFGHYGKLLCNLIAFAYPAYKSMKSVQSSSSTGTTHWLTYWMIFGLISLVDMAGDKINSWVPVYWLSKLLFMRYLHSPEMMGAQKIYTDIVQPAFMQAREVVPAEFDRVIDSNGFSITLFVLAYLLFGSNAKTLCNIFGLLYPAYFMIKEIRTMSRLNVAQWMTYWMIFGLFIFTSGVEEKIYEWFPLYWFCKNGAEKLFNGFIQPTFLQEQQSTAATSSAQASPIVPVPVATTASIATATSTRSTATNQQANQQQRLANDSDRICCVCQENEKRMLCEPCRHMCMCQSCSDTIMRGSKMCPICRRLIIKLTMIFW